MYETGCWLYGIVVVVVGGTDLVLTGSNSSFYAGFVFFVFHCW